MRRQHMHATLSDSTPNVDRSVHVQAVDRSIGSNLDCLSLSDSTFTFPNLKKKTLA
jgi:hypothetical protein